MRSVSQLGAFCVLADIFSRKGHVV